MLLEVQEVQEFLRFNKQRLKRCVFFTLIESFPNDREIDDYGITPSIIIMTRFFKLLSYYFLI